MQNVKRRIQGKKVIFVFGSNLAGIHGKGAALTALNKWGAVIGIGKGRTGRSYAIPTKDSKLRVLSLSRIAYYISQFVFYAGKHPSLYFYVTRIGCGLAGYKDNEIAPLFKFASDNVHLHFVEIPKEHSIQRKVKRTKH